jgi:hypothetical protein
MCLLVDEKSLLSSQTRVKRTTLVVLTKSNTAELCEIAQKFGRAEYDARERIVGDAYRQTGCKISITRNIRRRPPLP